MNAFSYAVRVASRDSVIVAISMALSAAFLSIMFIADPAFAVSCSIRSGYVTQGSSGTSAVVKAVASNNCNGNAHTVRVRLRMNDTFGKDETISQSEYYISTAYSSYSRSTQECRKGSHKYHEDQFLDGGQELRSPKDEDRTYNLC